MKNRKMMHALALACASTFSMTLMAGCNTAEPPREVPASPPSQNSRPEGQDTMMRDTGIVPEGGQRMDRGTLIDSPANTR